MIIQCNACEKSFIVPDNAITAKGRLVQCNSCGNKWTQFPVKKDQQKSIKKPSKTIIKEVVNNEKIKPVSVKKKKSTKKKTKTLNPYSEEYLKKKHGIKIINPSSQTSKKIKDKKTKIKTGFGFYGILIIMFFILITIFGILNLTREIIEFNFPFIATYVDHLFETFNNIKLIISDMISNY